MTHKNLEQTTLFSSVQSIFNIYLLNLFFSSMNVILMHKVVVL